MSAAASDRFSVPTLGQDTLPSTNEDPIPLGRDSLTGDACITLEEFGVSIVIPAFNEERRLPATLERYLPVLESRRVPFEVLVVVDGATDDTASVARGFEDRGVRALEFPVRLGKGGAIKAGMEQCRYAHVGYLDADGPIPASDIYRFFDALTTYDCVVASRIMSDSSESRNLPVGRYVLSRTWNALVRGLFFLPVRDTQCGAKFFRRSVVLPALKAVSITGWAFDVSLLYHISKQGHHISEVSTVWSHDSASHLRPTVIAPTMLLSLIGIWMMRFPLATRIPRRWVQRLSQAVERF